MNPDEISLGKELLQLIGGYADDQRCLLELLRFWGRHPSARFNRLAILHALDSEQSHVGKALGYLIDRGTVQSSSKNNVTLYFLTATEPIRGMVLGLARRDMRQHFFVAAQSDSSQGRVYA